MSHVLTPDEVRACIQGALPGSHVEITDLTGTMDHYEALVVAAEFAGESRIAQHQRVYRALGSLVGREIHALALKTLTPEAFALSRGNGGTPPGVQDGEMREPK